MILRVQARPTLLVSALLGLLLGNPLYAQGSSDTGGWKEIKPGGNTTCARGDEFSFFYFPTDSDYLVIDFMGGGACWNSETCSKDSATFTDTVEYVRNAQRRGLQGIYDHTKTENPVKNWNHVVIPYCTGDLHWGSNDTAYRGKGGKDFTIHHRGAENVKAVLDWVGKTYSQPKKILVTGCSAGSYGSIYWTPHIKEMYQDATVMQLGDAGAGVITKEFTKNTFPIWKPSLSGPAWIPPLDPKVSDWSNLTIPNFYRIISSHYPEVQFAQYNSAFDATQTFFYEIMGGDPGEWSAKMMSSVEEILQSTENFSSYIAPGEEHCIIPYDYFYTTTTQGVTFKDWFADYIAGKSVTSVKCVDCWKE